MNDIETTNVTDLLLRTTFSCMACDGDIVSKEIELIRGLALRSVSFGTVDIDNALISLTDEINKGGKEFLKSYLTQLANTELTKEDEINVLRIAAKIIQADNKIEYSEIKFFKIIRFNLKLDDRLYWKMSKK